MDKILAKPGHYTLTACLLVNQDTNNAIDLLGALSSFTISESINQNSLQFKADIHERTYIAKYVLQNSIAEYA